MFYYLLYFLYWCWFVIFSDKLTKLYLALSRMLHIVYVEAKNLQLHIQTKSGGEQYVSTVFWGKWEASSAFFCIVLSVFHKMAQQIYLKYSGVHMIKNWNDCSFWTYLRQDWLFDYYLVWFLQYHTVHVLSVFYFIVDVKVWKSYCENYSNLLSLSFRLFLVLFENVHAPFWI